MIGREIVPLLLLRYNCFPVNIWPKMWEKYDDSARPLKGTIQVRGLIPADRIQQ